MKKIYLVIAIAVMAVANAMAQKTAMLQLTNASDTENTAAAWFKENVTDGEFLTVDDLDKLTTENYSCLWIMVDRVGMACGAENLPDALNRLANTKLKPFVQAGGNLLLTGQATQLSAAMGRCPYAPRIYGDGAGGQNPDEWGIQAVIGNVEGQIYDHRSHAIFEGLEDNESYGHPTFALIGNGHKFDHNCMWDLNLGDYALADNPNKVADFEDKCNATVLGTWQHVVDYCCAGIVEFLPTTDYAGTVLCVGLAAYDWGQSEYNTNFGKFTANMVSYLSKSTTTIVGVESIDSKSAQTYNLAGQRVNDNAKGLVIKNGKAVIVK